MREHLKEQDVDGYVPIAEIIDDLFGTVVQRGSNNNNLMVLVEVTVFERLPKPATKIVCKVPCWREPSVNIRNVLWLELLHPCSVIQRLSHHLTRRALALQLNQDEGAVRRYCQEIYTPTKASTHLSADQHPLVRQDARLSDNHCLQKLFVAQR